MIQKYLILIVLIVSGAIGSLFWKYTQKQKTEQEQLHFSRIQLPYTRTTTIASTDFHPDRIFAQDKKIFLTNLRTRQVDVFSIQGQALQPLCQQLPVYPLVNTNVCQNTFSILAPNTRNWYRLTDTQVKKDTIPVIFSRGIEIDSLHVLLKGSRVALADESIYIYNRMSKQVTEQSGVIPPLHDGGLSTDGIFIKNASTGSIFFMMYLKGKFLCFDSTGKFQYAASTVDGFDKTYKVVRSNRGVTFAEPTRTVNLDACSNGVYVYILSNIHSKNGPADKSMVDVYLTESGKYVGSYALSPEVSSIAVEGNQLYAVQGKMIVQYDLSPVVKAI